MKRSREEPTVSSYSMLVRRSSSGRTMGTIRGPPACSFLRDYKGQGIVPNRFRHIYPIGGRARVCDCPAMEDSRRLVKASQSPGTLHIRSECIHIKTLDAIGNSFDQTPVKEYGPIAVLGNALSVAETEEPFGRVVVEIDAKARRYVCTACAYQKGSCKHVECVHEYVTEHDLHGVDPFLPLADEEDNGTMNQPQKGSIPEPISKKRISLDSFTERACKRRDSTDASTQWLATGAECVPPAHGCCSKCATPWTESTLVPLEASAKLYGCWQAMDVTVYERHCPCGEKRVYDGCEDGVFNMSNKTLWLHETMMTYVDLMVQACMPFNAYYNVLETQYGRRGKSELCSKSTLITSLEAFIGILDVDYDHCFSCPVCSRLPADEQVFIIDGTCMGFRRDLMKPAAPRSEGMPPPQHASAIPGTTFAYISGDKKAMMLCGKLREYSKARMIDDDEFSRMVRLAKEKAPELADVLKYIKSKGDYRTCPKRYRQFIYDVASPCPVSCLIPRSLYVEAGGLGAVLERILGVTTLKQADLTALMEWGSLAAVVQGMESIPAAFKPLLRKLLDLARVPESYVGDAASAVRMDMGDMGDDDEMSFFPNNPKIRSVRDYDDAPAGGKEETCTKHVQKSKRFTPGLFSVFCPHGIALGFEAMRTFESPRIPFKIFYERFQSAPGTIIFDNACQASRYCLRREPLYFSRTRFLIDRLHQHNHVICHSGYNMKFCPQSMPLLGGTMKLGDLNSQAAEQAHAKLELITKQTSFMRQDTFLRYTKLFLAMKNKALLKKM